MGFGVSNIIYNYKGNYIIIGSIYYMFVFFMFVLAPTSSNGVLPNPNQVIISWTILLVTILIGLKWLSRISVGYFLLVICTITYLMIITILSNHYDPNGRFSIARVAPIISFLLMSMLSIRISVSIKMVKFLIHLFMLVFIIWNLLIVIDNSYIKEFTISNFTQLYQDATANMFFKRRPIMSFGIYTFASFFYFLFFWIIKSLWSLTKKKIYLVYLILILIANILLVSNTSFIFSLIMIYYVYKSFENNVFRVSIILLVIFISFLLFENFNLMEYYLESFNSDGNGFKGRYTTQGTLSYNLQYIDRFFLIGFNIVNGLTYTDSGYVVLYTMGGGIFVIAMYVCLYRFLHKNIPNDLVYILIPILIFETALPVIIYYKFIYASIFLVMSLKSIDAFRLKQQSL